MHSTDNNIIRYTFVRCSITDATDTLSEHLLFNVYLRKNNYPISSSVLDYSISDTFSHLVFSCACRIRVVILRHIDRWLMFVITSYVVKYCVTHL